jgi:hypothetical protein
MSKLRDNSKGMMWTLLFFFVASMTVGGLVGGANILSTIQGFFGKIDTTLYVGKVGDQTISISYYLNERQIQLNRFRQQGRTLDSRTQQTAGDFAWNTIVDRTIKDEKIKELNLGVQDDEIYNFLLLSPPVAFQDNLKTLGLFSDTENNFDLDEYQNSVRNGLLPDTTQSLLLVWENYLRTYLADRKLQNLFNNTISLSDLEVKNEYILNNIDCTLDLLSIKSSSIPDSLISVSEKEILAVYENDKDDKYIKDESVSLRYVLWENISPTGVDSLDIIDLQDSLLQLAIDFSSDAQITSFDEALSLYNITEIDTAEVTESFNNNSGLPYQLGSIRQAVRFGFDENINETSDYFQTDNGLAVFNIISKNKSADTKLEEVSASISRSIKRDKKNDYAYKILLETNSSEEWDNISKNNDAINYSKNISGKLGASFETIGKNNELIGKLTNMNPGDITEVIKSSNSSFIVKVNDISTIDNDDYLANKDSLKSTIISRQKNQIFNEWLKNEKDKIEITDLRSKIF